MKSICDCREYIKDKASRLTVFDFAVLKSTLFSVGMLIGTYCTRFVKRYRAFILLIAVCSYIYLIYRIFFRDRCRN